MFPFVCWWLSSLLFECKKKKWSPRNNSLLPTACHSYCYDVPIGLSKLPPRNLTWSLKLDQRSLKSLVWLGMCPFVLLLFSPWAMTLPSQVHTLEWSVRAFHLCIGVHCASSYPCFRPCSRHYCPGEPSLTRPVSVRCSFDSPWLQGHRR